MKYPIRKQANIILGNIRGRLRYSTVHGFEHYGGKGIKNTLTRDDIIALLVRDNAEWMEKPSIDRINSDGDYSIDNCRIIEHRKNCGVHAIQICSECGGAAKHKNLCLSCRIRIRKTRECVDCKKPFVPKNIRKLACQECCRVSRPCAYCGSDVVRFKYAGYYASVAENKQWFCSKSHQGSWLHQFSPYQKGCHYRSELGCRSS